MRGSLFNPVPEAAPAAAAPAILYWSPARLAALYQKEAARRRGTPDSWRFPFRAVLRSKTRVRFYRRIADFCFNRGLDAGTHVVAQFYEMDEDSCRRCFNGQVCPPIGSMATGGSLDRHRRHLANIQRARMETLAEARLLRGVTEIAVGKTPLCPILLHFFFPLIHLVPSAGRETRMRAAKGRMLLMRDPWLERTLHALLELPVVQGRSGAEGQGNLLHGQRVLPRATVEDKPRRVFGGNLRSVLG